MAAPRYKDMTPEERQAAFDGHLEYQANCFVGLDSRSITRSRPAVQGSLREMSFIGRIARSCGDGWVKTQAYRGLV